MVGTIIFLHLYKIRYLNYFITIEDQEVSEKVIEESIEKIENKYYQEKKKEKIIIRDAKHSTFSFFEGLGKLAVIMIKMMVIFSAAIITPMLVLSIGLTVLSLYHVQYGVIFLWIAMICLGINILMYLVLEWAYKFVIARKQAVKRLFITGIARNIVDGNWIRTRHCGTIRF